MGSAEQARAPRVLVVRSAKLRDRVAAAIEAARIDAQVQASPSYLSAMGLLTHERLDAVIGPVSAMTGMVGSTARALRRLSPGTRLIAVAGHDRRAEAEAALTAGFDQCVYEPADATALIAALRLASLNPGPPTAQTPTDTSPAAVVASAVEKTPGGQAPAATHAIDWLRFGFDPQPPPVDPPQAVGDVDLAEAVMRGDGSLMPMAMRLLREQSGMGDAELVAEAQAGALSVPSAGVVYEGRPYGVLASGTGDGQALAAWAAWLARWAALGRRQDDLYGMAMHDELTGLWNRRYFDRFLDGLIHHAGQGRQQVTLLLFDIDDFKQYNDKYGHPAGDEILRSTASLIQSLVREHDVVARIGGDEFAVVFWDKGEPRHLGSQHPDSVIGIAKRFQKAICEHRFPKLGEEAVGQLTVSGGLAGFPWDGRTKQELVERADANAIASKRQGKNAICFGPGAAPSGEH